MHEDTIRNVAKYREYVERAMEIKESDDRVATVRFYLNGFVPNSYTFSAPGTMVLVTLPGDGLSVGEYRYDRKRPHGRGPSLVAASASGGRLYSE